MFSLLGGAGAGSVLVVAIQNKNDNALVVARFERRGYDCCVKKMLLLPMRWSSVLQKNSFLSHKVL